MMEEPKQSSLLDPAKDHAAMLAVRHGAVGAALCAGFGLIDPSRRESEELMKKLTGKRYDPLALQTNWAHRIGKALLWGAAGWVGDGLFSYYIWPRYKPNSEVER